MNQKPDKIKIMSSITDELLEKYNTNKTSASNGKINIIDNSLYMNSVLVLIFQKRHINEEEYNANVERIKLLLDTDLIQNLEQLYLFHKDTNDRLLSVLKMFRIISIILILIIITLTILLFR